MGALLATSRRRAVASRLHKANQGHQRDQTRPTYAKLRHDPHAHGRSGPEARHDRSGHDFKSARRTRQHPTVTGMYTAMPWRCIESFLRYIFRFFMSPPAEYLADTSNPHAIALRRSVLLPC